MGRKIKREGIKIATYVVTGATLKCNCGDKESNFQAAADRTVFINGKAQGNVEDFAAKKNIMPFGKCQTTQNPTVAAATAANQGKLKPMTCEPIISSSWKNGKTDELIQGAAALMDHSMVLCKWGGQIIVENDGQSSKFATDGAVGAQTEKTQEKTEEQPKTAAIQNDMKKDFQTLAQKQQTGASDADDFEKNVKTTYKEFLESHKDPNGGVSVIGLRGWGVGTRCRDTDRIKGERNTYDDMFVVIATNGNLSVFSRCNFEGTTATGTYGEDGHTNGNYPSIQDGVYDLNSWVHNDTYRDVVLRNNDVVPTINGNPTLKGNPKIATGIEIHRGGNDWTWSKGCLTIYAPSNDKSRWNRFISNFPITANGVRVGLLDLMTL